MIEFERANSFQRPCDMYIFVSTVNTCILQRVERTVVNTLTSFEKENGLVRV